MNVGILTYHWEDNYGATLQAYATYKAVASLGHNPVFIDLRLPYSPGLIGRIVFGLKHKRFDDFRKRFFRHLTPVTYRDVDSLRRNPPALDVYLTGSDQTWNPLIAKDLLPAFFLTFGDTDVRRVTYATSIGLNEWSGSPAISDDEIRTALDSFSHINLREDSAIEICRARFGHEARQVVDPVLLFSDYPELVPDRAESGEVVAYKLIDDSEFYRLALATAHHIGAPIRSIGSVRRPKGFRAGYPERVEKWVERIATARLVLTDSFHGTVFSLLYHRPFVVYVGDPARVTRIRSLLEQLGLTDRILSHHSSVADMKRLAMTPIDWDHVDSTLASLRKDSFDSLSRSLTP